jgi:hypothetical protein
MNDLTVPPTAAVTLTGGNAFDVVFQSAQPTLDVIVQMRAPLAWLDRRRNYKSFEPSEVFKVIPPEADLVRARQLFREAEHEPAPEGWTGIALALLADSMPAAHRVSDTWVCSIVDALYRDAETCENYEPGVSYGVATRSIREARRLDGLPTPGAFLEICARHRRLFKQWRADLMTLANIRFDAIHGPVPF